MILKRITGALVLALGVFSLGVSNSPSSLYDAPIHNAKNALATSTDSEEIGVEYDGAGFNESETIPLGEQMLVSITSSTYTDTTQSYTFRFSSQFNTYYTRYRDLNFTINDPTFDVNADYSTDLPDSELPHFEAYVYSIKPRTSGSNRGHVIIPSQVVRKGFYVLDIVGIMSDAVIKDQAEGIEAIDIPSSVVSVYDNALTNLPETCEINVAYAEDNLPEGYSEFWTDSSNVNYGVELEETSYNVSGTSSIGTGENFIYGFLGNEQTGIEQLPLRVTYDVVHADGSVETKHFYPEIEHSQGNRYEGCGSSIAGSSATKFVDIPLAKGDFIDDESIVLSNIYKAERSEISQRYEPLVSDGQFSVHPSISYKEKYSVDYFLNMEYDSTKSFSGYTYVSTKIDQQPDIYQELNYSTYSSYKDRLESNSNYQIRYRFTQITTGNYKVSYLSNNEIKTVEVSTKSPVAYFQIKKGNDNLVTFEFKNEWVGEDFDPKNLISFSLEGMSITLDIFNKSTNAIITKSNVSTRFGSIPIYEQSFDLNFLSVNSMYIFIFIGYVALFAAVTAANFFYKKNKYKNDEFKRVNPRSFFINAGVALVGVGTILLSILTIVSRATFLNNSVVTYNPIDVVVIVSSIFAILFLGYYIRYFVTEFKAYREKKKVEALKLNEDKADDGTN